MIIQRHSNFQLHDQLSRELLGGIGQRLLDAGKEYFEEFEIRLFDEDMTFARFRQQANKLPFRDHRKLMFPSDMTADSNVLLERTATDLFKIREGRTAPGALKSEFDFFRAAIDVDQQIVAELILANYAFQYWQLMLLADAERWLALIRVQQGRLLFPKDIYDRIEDMFTIKATNKQIEDFAAIEAIISQIKPFMKKYPKLHESLSFEGNQFKIKRDFLL